MKSLSISFRKSSKEVRSSLKHNQRNPEDVKHLKNFDGHIDSARTQYNLHLKECKSVHKLFNALYKPAVDDYNSKAEERAKRQHKKKKFITDAYSHFKAKANAAPTVEFVVGIGKKGDLDLKSAKNRRLLGATFKGYLKGFEDRNSALHIASAQVHFDESSPHMHIVAIPMAKGYKRGLSMHPSLNRALGLRTKEDFAEWTEKERGYLSKSLERRTAVTRKKVGSKNADSIRSINRYREMMQKLDKEAAKKKQFLLAAQSQAVSDAISSASSSASIAYSAIVTKKVSSAVSSAKSSLKADFLASTAPISASLSAKDSALLSSSAVLQKRSTALDSYQTALSSTASMTVAEKLSASLSSLAEREKAAAEKEKAITSLYTKVATLIEEIPHMTEKVLLKLKNSKRKPLPPVQTFTQKEAQDFISGLENLSSHQSNQL